MHVFLKGNPHREKSGKQKEKDTVVTTVEYISFTLDITAFRNL